MKEVFSHQYRRQCKASDTVQRNQGQVLKSPPRGCKNVLTVKMSLGHVLAVKLTRTDTTLDSSLNGKECLQKRHVRTGRGDLSIGRGGRVA